MENKEKLPGFAIYSKSGKLTFNFYSAVKSSEEKGSKYLVQDSSLRLIKKCDSFKEAKNFARYCAEAVCYYMNSQSKISKDLTEENIEEGLKNIALNFAIFDEDAAHLFKKEHGYGPKATYHAMSSGINPTYYQIRFDNIQTNVIFEDKEMAVKSLNSYLSIYDWEVYDWWFDADC